MYLLEYGMTTPFHDPLISGSHWLRSGLIVPL